MYASQAMSKDLNLPFPAEPDLRHSHQQQQMTSGMLRYRSAPSTLLGDDREEFLPHRAPSTPEEESMFARFMGSAKRSVTAVGSGQRSTTSQFMPGVDQEVSDVGGPPETGGFPSSALQMPFHSSSQQQHQLFPNFSSAGPTVAAENGASGNRSLVRQSSSPAGLFTRLDTENGFSIMRGMGGGFRPVDGSNDEQGPAAASGWLKGQISFGSRQGSSGLTQISELGSDGFGGSSPGENGNGNARCFVSGYPVSSWEDSVLLSDNFEVGAKRGRDPSESQNHVGGLTHQFSLPKTSSEMATMEKYLQFQDAVPCRIRAKRGCATHPRSIAERVRRTRISDRMRKLQELVPNMDKQTNTADMLDLAVDHIKNLQRSLQTLTESREKCTCGSKQKP